MLVAGAPRKWGGQLVDVDLDRPRTDVVESRDAVQRRVAASAAA